VYCFDENDILNIREVTIGLDTGSFVEITGGLEEGDQVTVDS
jgi:multidrug efflux pump subunit AcrA (membrane-fusion protein)